MMDPPRRAGQGTLDSWLAGSSGGRQSTPVSRTTPTVGRAPRRQDDGGNDGAPKPRFRAPRGDPSQRAELVLVSQETRRILPGILGQLPRIQADKSQVMFLSELPELQSSNCPRQHGGNGARIKIVNEDTLNAAIRLKRERPGSGRVAVLNMASHSHAGGGWRTGAMAQEEAICYRSSLALSLHRRYYPWKRQRMGIYTGDVVVVRSDMPSGHKLLLGSQGVAAPVDLPVVSVLSIAALRCPDTRTATFQTTPHGNHQRLIFARPEDRDLTKDKMRLCLRVAASKGHRLLVLGALGCGAFRNPPREVANCWLEVFAEQEFQGGWWDQVWFAVYDAKNEGNFELFDEVLGDVQV